MPERTWTTLAKVAAGTIAAIASLIFIYSWYRTKEPNISASGDCYAFSLSDDFYNQLNQLSTIPDTPQIDDLLPESLDHKYEIASKIHTLISKDKNIYLVRNLKNSIRYAVSLFPTLERRKQRISSSILICVVYIR